MANFSPTSNTRVAGGLISGRSIYAAGTTNFYSTQGASATIVPPSGQILSAGSVKSTGPTVSTTFVRAGTGFVFQGAGDVKQFAAGTCIGTGGATMAIVNTGLTTIHGVWVEKYTTAYGNATTGNVLCRPSLAAGTTSSFYPLAFKLTGTSAIWALNTVASTFKWFAVGAKTVTI